MVVRLTVFFFFFSSRRRHTRLTCDWSSDVCSSDLLFRHGRRETEWRVVKFHRTVEDYVSLIQSAGLRSEERRVGKEGRSRGSPDHKKKKKETTLVSSRDKDGF